MAIMESIQLDNSFPFRFLVNYGYRLTTPHFHSEYEILYVEKGSINLGIGNELFRLEEKQMFVIRPYLEHYIVPELESIRHVFQFKEEMLGNILSLDHTHQLRNLNPVSFYWSEEVNNEIDDLLNIIKEEVTKKNIGYEEQIRSNLLRLYVLLVRNECDDYKEYKESKKMNSLKNVFLYVEEHYKDKIYIEDVADYLGYSTEYFSRFFKKHIGLNFTDFLLDYRLTKARWDLLTTEDSIHQIIYNNGFSNTATFYRNFKEYSGYSPKEYRKKHKR